MMSHLDINYGILTRAQAGNVRLEKGDFSVKILSTVISKRKPNRKLIKIRRCTK